MEREVLFCFILVAFHCRNRPVNCRCRPNRNIKFFLWHECIRQIYGVCHVVISGHRPWSSLFLANSWTSMSIGRNFRDVTIIRYNYRPYSVTSNIVFIWTFKTTYSIEINTGGTVSLAVLEYSIVIKRGFSFQRFGCK